MNYSSPFIEVENFRPREIQTLVIIIQQVVGMSGIVLRARSATSYYLYMVLVSKRIFNERGSWGIINAVDAISGWSSMPVP